jgi:hypothetical protein
MASAAMVMPAASVARTGTSRTRTLRGSAGARSSANAMRSLGLLRRAFAASFATIGSMITADSLNTAMVQHDTLDRPSGIVKRGAQRGSGCTGWRATMTRRRSSTRRASGCWHGNWASPWPRGRGDAVQFIAADSPPVVIKALTYLGTVESDRAS